MEHKITVVGIGPGSLDYLPPIAQKIIAQATVLIGSRRALNDFAGAGVETKIIDHDIAGVMDFIHLRLPEQDVVVMVSGDPGYYSLLAALRLEFSPDLISVIPGVSSLQLAFARLACPWQDATLVSLHGRAAPEEALGYRPGKKMGILTDSQHNPCHIARLLIAGGWPTESKVWLCANLSYPDEKIVAMTLGDALDINGFGHCVMVVMT